MRQLIRGFLAIAVLATTAAAARGEGGTLIVLNKAEATVSLLDLATGREVAKVATGAGPHEVAVSADGKLALVADYGEQTPGSTLTLIDVEKAAVVKKIDLAPHRRPHGIVWLGEELRVVVTSETSRALLEVDVAAGKVERAIATNQDATHMVAVTPDQRLAFTANIGSGSTTMIDLVEGVALASVKTGAGAEGIDVAPDGASVWVSNREADTVSVVDVATRAVVATLPCAGFPIRVKVTPDGRHALASCATSGEIALFDARKRVELRRFKTGLAADSTPIGILIHPDGSRAWIAHAKAEAIAVIDCAKWEAVGTLKAGKGPDGLGFSPLVVAGAGTR